MVALDLVDGCDTDRTRLDLARTNPIPFPPEPLRWRGTWLRMLDAIGMGSDS